MRSLQQDDLLAERVERLMTIPAVGPITALTWALEVGDVQRFRRLRKPSATAGCAATENSSANTVQRTPSFETAQQTSANHADRSGQDGPALQPDAGTAL